MSISAFLPSFPGNATAVFFIFFNAHFNSALYVTASLYPGEKPFLCDKCGRGFNRVDNLRSHVKTVHQGKAGMKRLVVVGSDSDGGSGGADKLHPASTSASELDDSEVNIVTVTTDDIVTLATEALAGSAVAQLTGWSALYC